MSEKRELSKYEEYLTDAKFRLCRYMQTTFEPEQLSDMQYFGEPCEEATEHGDCKKDGRACDAKLYQLKEITLPPDAE